MYVGQALAIADLSTTAFEGLPAAFQTDPALVPTASGILAIWAVKSALPGDQPGTFRPLTRREAYPEHARAVCQEPHRGPEPSDDHEAPTLLCSCGFYAVRIGNDPPRQEGSIRLQVALTGIVVVHELGYRAEVQTVVRPLGVPGEAPELSADALLVDSGRQALSRAQKALAQHRELQQRRRGPEDGSGQAALRPTPPAGGAPGFALRLPPSGAQLPTFPTPDLELAAPASGPLRKAEARARRELSTPT